MGLSSRFSDYSLIGINRRRAANALPVAISNGRHSATAERWPAW